MWSNSAYNAGNLSILDMYTDKKKYNKLFVEPVAENLYQDIKKSGYAFQHPDSFNKEFKDLTKSELSFWHDYAANIPYKFKTINLFIRPFTDFCRTCIITDNEVSSLAQTDIDILRSNKSFQSRTSGP